MKKPLSIRDVARHALVHPMTVSRALRNHPSISVATRKRIRDIAARLGYEVNPLVRALMTHIRTGKTPGHQGNIAFLVPDTEIAGKAYGYRKLLLGIEPRARELGYMLDVIPLQGRGGKRQKLSRIIEARGIHGLLIPPLVEVPRGQLDWKQFAAVAIGDRGGTPLLHLVRNDHSQTMILALDHLRGLGYRRIGLYLLGMIDEAIQHHWTALWLYHQEHCEPSHRIPALTVASLDERQFLEWLRSYRPEVVLTKHIQVQSWLEGAGIRVPHDVGFVHLDWIPEFGGSTGVNQNMEETGATAVDLLVDQLYRNERGIPRSPKTVLSSSSWVQGRTVQARRLRPQRR